MSFHFGLIYMFFLNNLSLLLACLSHMSVAGINNTSLRPVLIAGSLECYRILVIDN